MKMTRRELFGLPMLGLAQPTPDPPPTILGLLAVGKQTGPDQYGIQVRPEWNVILSADQTLKVERANTERQP